MPTLQVQLPSQTGCEHIHITLVYPDRAEFYAYHMTDFTLQDLKEDPLYVKLKEMIQQSGAKTRQQIKNALEGQVITL